MGTCDFCHKKTEARRIEIPMFLGGYGQHSVWGHPLTGNACPRCLVKELEKALTAVKQGLSYDGER